MVDLLNTVNVVVKIVTIRYLRFRRFVLCIEFIVYPKHLREKQTLIALSVGVWYYESFYLPISLRAHSQWAGPKRESKPSLVKQRALSAQVLHGNV